MAKKNKALYCYGSINPDPNGGGAARRFWANIRALEMAGYDVVEVQFTENANPNGKNIVLLREWQRPNSSNWFGYQFFKWIFPFFQPQAYFYPQFDRNAANQLDCFVDKYKPDLIFYEHSAPWAAGAQLNLDIPSFVSVHDFDDVLYGIKGIDYVNKVKPAGFRRSVALLRERWIAFCLRKYSFKLFSKSNHVITCGKGDFDAINKKGINSVFIPIPVFQIPGADNLKRIEKKLDERSSFDDIVKIVHVGALSNSHNIKGLSWFLEKCFPILKNKLAGSNYQIHLIGSMENASLEIMKFKDEPNLCFRDYVKDLETELSEADFAIVPSGYPTGFRTKIPEAFAYGLPVVTGHCDAYNVGVNIDDPRVILADDPDAFVNACVRLINDNELRHKMGKMALITWCEDYDSEKIYYQTAEWVKKVDPLIEPKLANISRHK